MKQFAVKIVLFYIKFFAKLALLIHKPYTIGIAGSVGKSSTRNAIYSTLKDYFPTYDVKGNSETGIPLGILGFKPGNYTFFDWIKVVIASPFRIFNLWGSKYMVVEMGIDDPYPPKNMEYLLTIIKPDTAISLNVSATHTMQFEKLLNQKPGTQNNHDFLLQKIAEEDTKIITKSNCKIAIYNADDKWISSEIKKADLQIPTLTFGEERSNAIFFRKYEVNLEGTAFGLNSDRQIALYFQESILPKAYQEVFAAAILATKDIVGSLEKVASSLEKNFKLPNGRSSFFKGINNSYIIDSSYNASKTSVLEFVELLKELKFKTKSPAVFLFGDMRELGGEAEAEHKEVAEKLSGIDYVYLIGPLTKQFVLPNLNVNDFKEIKWFEDSNAAGEFLAQNLPQKSIILVKGSQNTIFLEEAVEKILSNKEDIKKLCRQDKSWTKVKKFAS